MKPTLVVLAAGMGSRYGSLKQMDGVGPNGEAIIDYSIYDAIRAGFGKIVFIIRHSFEKEFKALFNNQRFGDKITIEYAFQELDLLPEGFTLPEGREKPWGTNHAILAAKEFVDEPFAVINADDFYGKDGYKTIHDYLISINGQEGKYSMVGYQIENTLSEHGSVSRGICQQDDNNNLITMVEHTKVFIDGTRIYSVDEDDYRHNIDPGTPVSMNLFGFTPDYFSKSEEYFKQFLNDNIGNLKSEYFIALMVNHCIKEGSGEFRVLQCDASWFGVTYKEDRDAVVSKIRTLIDAGEYPSNLWAK